MLIGVVVGTYSSIFIASPLLLFLEKRYGEDHS
jgi:preprotein translocase subunit SecF